MLSSVEILILSAIQGISEFLPVSSAAHFVLVSKYYAFTNQSLIIDICLHLGSLIAIIVYFKNDLFNFSLEKFSDYFNVNVLALFSVCREFARNNNNGTIINFSSTYGIVSPNPNLYTNSMKDIAYGVTKAAVINLTKYLAVHLAPKIRVNTVVPGGIRFNQNKKFVNDYSKLTPMKRMMEKNELNELISYLSSKNSSYVTGSTIVCDGGYTIW